MKAAVTTLDNKKAGDITLADEVFGLPLRKDILARMVNYQLHKVKERGEVAGSTRKIVRQKGSGGARHGSKRANIFRGGGVVHGPRVRSHDINLPKKVRALALKTALSAKAAEGKLIVLDSDASGSGKTKELRDSFDKLGWSNVLIVGGSALDENFARAARNLPGVDVLPQQGANVYDILRRDTLVLTKAAVEALEARLK